MMAEEKADYLRPLEALKIVVQVVAIIVAGYWTYLKFIRTEAPLFERTAHVDHSLSPPVMLENGNYCLRNFWIGIKNTGKTTFDVTQVVTRAWKFKFEREEEFITLVDLDEIEKQGELVLKKEFPDLKFGKDKWYPFLQTYRPSESYGHGFQVRLKNEPHAWIFLKTELFIEGEDKNRPKVGGDWDLVCGEIRPKALNKMKPLETPGQRPFDDRRDSPP